VQYNVIYFYNDIKAFSIIFETYFSCNIILELKYLIILNLFRNNNIYSNRERIQYFITGVINKIFHEEILRFASFQEADFNSVR